MAITLVTPGASASSTAAFSGRLTSAANDAPFSFGTLLSLQISGLPIAATPEPSLETEAAAATDEATTALSIMDSGELLAGMLAASPARTPSTSASEEGRPDESTLSDNSPDASLIALFTNPTPPSIPATTTATPQDEGGTVLAQGGVFELLGHATAVEEQLAGGSSKTAPAANFAADTEIPPTSLPESTQRNFVTEAPVTQSSIPMHIPEVAVGKIDNLQHNYASVSLTTPPPSTVSPPETPLSTDNTQRDFAAAALAAQSASHARTPATPAKSTDIPTPLQDKNWSQNFGESIVWLSKNNQQSAQLNINPPELGPVQIHLKLNGDQATAAFASPHAEVRQAIEDAMPRLRELMAGAGIDLGQTNVGSQMAQQERGNQGQTPDSPRFSDDKAILREDVGLSGARPVTTERSGQGMVDLFA